MLDQLIKVQEDVARISMEVSGLAEGQLQHHFLHDEIEKANLKYKLFEDKTPVFRSKRNTELEPDDDNEEARRAQFIN